jgi:RNA polymerase sigma-70 factor (ECF subfamily)
MECFMAVADSRKSEGQKEWDECLQAIAASNSEAFADFFNHFAPLIKAFAFSGSSLSAIHADELVQEVMIKVWQKAAAFDPKKASATTWLYAVARNCRTDLYRKLRKFDTPLTAEDLMIEEESQEAFDLLQIKRNAETIRDKLQALPNEQRQVIAKIYMEGKSHSEVSAELDLPLGTVKSRVRLAVNKLGVQLAPMGGSRD